MSSVTAKIPPDISSGFSSQSHVEVGCPGCCRNDGEISHFGRDDDGKRRALSSAGCASCSFAPGPFVMSHFTTQSTASLVHRHDGHHDGYLNCLAIRHGWTRTFSIAPGELGAMDYGQLERILELNTLRLRPYMVRIFVEEPAGSGTFAKVRFWKDDGSLQSVLVKEFFERRMNEGGITTFELRDGRERANEDDTDMESAFASKTSLALAKFRRRKRDTNGSTATSPAPTPSIKTGTARFFDFFRLPGSIKPAPPRSVDMPLGIDEDDDEDDDLPPSRTADPEEQALLQRRGWMPPLFRRITGQTTATTATAESTGTSLRRRSTKGKGRDLADVEPGDEDAVPLSEEEWEVQDSVPDMQGTNGRSRPALFARLSGRDKDEQSIGLKKGKNKNKNKNKGGKGQKAFQGAERVQRPEDALPPPPPSKGEGSSTAKNPFAD